MGLFFFFCYDDGMAKKEEPFHAPFKKLKGVKVASGKRASAPEPAKPKQPPAEPDDREIFALAMRGVTPQGGSYAPSLSF